LATTSAATAFALVQSELQTLEQILGEAARPSDPVMGQLLGLVLPGGGKRLRPLLALLWGRSHNHRRERLIPFAAALELLHTATLVHDDIVDEATVRRGEPTLSARVRNSIAVLVGDYLFAQAAAQAVSTDHVGVMRSFTATSMDIITGQIDESMSDGVLTLTQEQYLRRIGGKTAALFALSARGGAMLSDAPERVVFAAEQYGYKLGLAFQIVDDILDVVGDARDLGKPVGSDMRQGVATLPALLVRDQVPTSLFQAAYSGGGKQEESIRLLLETIRSRGGVEGSYAEADRLKADAYACLEVLPHGPVRDALLDLGEFVVQRVK